MPAPPSNDDFASAIDLGVIGNSTNTPSSGFVIGDLTLATAQIGEPKNHGHTVWYKFTAASDPPAGFWGSICFHTRYNPATWDTINPPTPVGTSLHAYQGSDVKHLTEMSYITDGNWTDGYAYYDTGSLIVFNVQSSQTYYIRVDSAASGAVGKFSLSWYQPYIEPRLGKCSGCPPMTDAGWICAGSTGNNYDINDPSGTVTLDFGTVQPGTYAIRYCGGAWQLFDNDDNPKIQWFVMLPAGSGDRADHSIGYPEGYWVVNYNGGTATVDITGLYDLDDLISQADAEWHNQCGGAQFCHTGGHVSLVWTTMPVIAGGIAPGTPLPTWSLYQINPFLAQSACADWTGPGTAECTFTFKNISKVELTGLTVTLNNTGGITNASAPFTGINISAGGDAIVYFTFKASSPNVTATLSITGCGTNNISYNLSPLVTFTGASAPVPPGGLGCFDGTTFQNIYKITVSTKNLGTWKATPLTAQLTVDQGIHFAISPGGQCTNLSVITLTNQNAGGCNGGLGSITLYVIRTHTVPTTGNFTITLFDTNSGANLGTFKFTGTIPA